MFNLNEYNARYDAHTDLVARIDRDGWHEMAPKVSNLSFGFVGGFAVRAGQLISFARSIGRLVPEQEETQLS